MKGSLQEQLLKSGLVKKDRAKDSKKQTKKTSKKKQKQKIASQSRQSQVKTPSAEDLQKEKETRAQVKKVLRSYKLNDKNAEIAHNYTINKQVKRFFVTEVQQKGLIDGELAIANWNEISYLIPKAAVAEVRNLYPKIDIYITEPETDKSNEEDPYADYVIPDDMKW